MPLALAVLAVPGRLFSSASARSAFVAGLLAAAVVPGALWMALVGASAVIPPGVHADPPGQIVFLRTEPLRFAAIALETCVRAAGPWARSFIGVLGHLDVPLPGVATVGYGASLLASARFDGRDPASLGAGRRVLLLAVFASCTAVMLTLAYVGFNSVGSPLVHGIQGRYFFPMALLPLVALPSRPSRRAARWRPVWVAALPALVLATAVVAVVRRYYVF